MQIPIAELLVYVASFLCYLKFRSYISLHAAEGTKENIRLVSVMHTLMFFGWIDVTASCIAIIKCIITGEL